MTPLGQITDQIDYITYDVHRLKDVSHPIAEFHLLDGKTSEDLALVVAAKQDDRNGFVLNGQAYAANPAGNDHSLAKIKLSYGAVYIDLAVAVPSVAIGSNAGMAPVATAAKLAAPAAVAAPKGQPGPSNTGIAAGSVLKVSSPKPTNGSVVENLSIKGTLTLNGLSNVTIRNCKIDGNGGYYGIKLTGHCSGILIEHCEITNASAAGIIGGGMTVRACNIHHTSGDGIKPGSNSVIDGNWIHYLGYNAAGAHADGCQVVNGDSIKIIRNFFDMGLDVPNTHANAWLMVQGGTHITFDGNWCKGGNYGINGDSHTSAFTNNVCYRNSTRYGFVRGGTMTFGAGNVFDDGTPCKATDK